MAMAELDELVKYMPWTVQRQT
ncbi:hypothetical protein CCACVL1_13991 [Corchorus capsularis]|uniref:Uncharacterized protein n=1 Tax=Corchorus capsularis TaxID=210143 RepID=A0A1R3I8R7_COCAP|nr:hypothetical protein CCACVL1_13991 [Corchorus capsularis]